MSGEIAVLVDKSAIFVEATVKPGEGWILFAKRLTGADGHSREVAAANPGARRPLEGARYRVPFSLLVDRYRVEALEAIFSRDRKTPEAWIHVGRGEPLERVAEWFAGGADRAPELARASALPRGKFSTGQSITIPRQLLRPALAERLPAPPPPKAAIVPPVSNPPTVPTRDPFVGPPRPPASVADATEAFVGPPPPPAFATNAREPFVGPPALSQAGMPSGEPAAEPHGETANVAPASPGIVAPIAPAVGAPTSGAELLDYGEDARGKFAVYRIRPGEALYSAVVIRFTGRIHADDVNALAAEIAKRSGIADVTSIPVGFEVKIPRDLLLPQFLAEDDPRRIEWEVEEELASRFKNEVRTKRLEGVTVILDPGHGGSDVGAMVSGIWESLYVYDIALRVKALLESATLAHVETTTRDGASYAVPDRDVLPTSRGHAVLTTPPYPIEDSTVGLHLRWYLANSLFRRAVGGGRSDQRVVFVSIHADSLHPSLRGATAYVPDTDSTGGTFGKGGPVFDQRKEVREQPSVGFALPDRRRSEGLSRQLAERVIAAFGADELPVHPYSPVRDKIFRGRHPWVPAVLRYNAIPAKFLLEVCNLANDEDRKLLLTRDFRSRVARSIVDGILGYFGEGAIPAPVQRAAR